MGSSATKIYSYFWYSSSQHVKYLTVNYGYTCMFSTLPTFSFLHTIYIMYNTHLFIKRYLHALK